LGIGFQIIENHQGWIKVMSEEQVGTEFMITLPVHETPKTQ
jgi:signal transduction histidine kinase